MLAALSAISHTALVLIAAVDMAMCVCISAYERLRSICFGPKIRTLPELYGDGARLILAELTSSALPAMATI